MRYIKAPAQRVGAGVARGSANVVGVTKRGGAGMTRRDAAWGAA
jgi:hypothetical protein